jgi:hypothetical protein
MDDCMVPSFCGFTEGLWTTSNSKMIEARHLMQGKWQDLKMEEEFVIEDEDGPKS